MNLTNLSKRLAILMGSGLAILSGGSKLNAKVVSPALPQEIVIETNSPVAKPLPPKLVLKQMANGYKMVAQHDSHSSHSSHSSHTSGGFA